jgi:hypothetical protein
MLNFTVSVITIDNITVTSATTVAATTRRPWCFGGRAAVLGGGDDGAMEVGSAIGRASRSAVRLLRLTFTTADAANDGGDALMGSCKGRSRNVSMVETNRIGI